MTLHVLSDLTQGSEEWHDQRRGIVTASVVGKLITPTLKVANNDTARAVTATLAAERITGWTEETAMTSDMWRGVESEPFAREIYSDNLAPVEEVGFMVRDDWGYRIGFSPDGLVGDDGAIEIKAPRAKTHMNTILADEVPSYYMAQCQTGLLVSGRKWIDFVSYVGGMPLYVKRVLPDPAWAEAVVAVVALLELGQPATEVVAHLVAVDLDVEQVAPVSSVAPLLDLGDRAGVGECGYDLSRELVGGGCGGSVGERLHLECRALAAGDEQGDRLGLAVLEVGQVADPCAADDVAAESDGLVAVEGDAPADPRGGVGSPAGGKHSAHGLAGAPDAGELGEVDVDGLVVLALGDVGDGEGLGLAEKVHGVELVGVGCECVADVEGHVRQP